MPVSSILDSTSFSTLDDAGQKTVRQLFDNTYRAKKELALDNLPLFRQRKSLAVSLDFYSSRLNNVNSSSFSFMNKPQRAVLHQELLFTFYLLSAEYQLTAQLNLDASDSRRQKMRELGDQIKHCARLIKELRLAAKKRTPETILASATDDDSEKYLKYLGLTLIAPEIVKGVLAVTTGDPQAVEQWAGEGTTVVIKDGRQAVNPPRLYWVWAGNLVLTLISLLPDSFANKRQAERVVASPSPITGYMSFMLYFTNAGVELLLLAKHTLRGNWMSEAEKELQVPAWERFTTQWELRKFSILNDFIWATGNMVCFFWLIGNAGYYGNVLTAGLLLMDVTLTIWRFCEENTNRKADMKRFARDRDELLGKITNNEEEQKQLKLQLDAFVQMGNKSTSDGDSIQHKIVVLQAEKAILDGQLRTQTKAQDQYAFEWKYKKYNLINDLAYAIGLVAAFSLMCCFFLSATALAPATALLLSVTGAVSCFGLTVLYDSVGGWLQIRKSNESGHSVKNECEVLLRQFSALKMDKEKDPNGFVKKQLYLYMKQLCADNDYQVRVVHFQKMKLIQAVLIKMLVPALVFASFIFMPLGMGFAVLASGFALAIISNKILNNFDPKAANLPNFDVAKYDKFAQLVNPTFDDLKENKPGFFSQSKPTGPSLAPPYDGFGSGVVPTK